MAQHLFVIIESSEIFTRGVTEILRWELDPDAYFLCIHSKSDLELPDTSTCILIGNGLGTEMSLAEILVYIKSLNLKVPIICIPEMLTSKQARQFYSDKLTDGILHRNCKTEEIIKGVRSVMAGEVYIGNDVNLHQTREQSILQNKNNDPFYLIQTLTDQERIIMDYVIEGKSSYEISQILFRSIHTIKTHRRNLLHKLGVSNTIELIAYLDSINYGR